MSILSKLTGAQSVDELLSQVSDGFFGTDYQKDYSHASKLMRPNNLALAPKQKFLFHVFFTLTDPRFGPADQGLIGALVKSIQLPSFSIDTEEHVQYNRKRLVHNKIKYEPITVVLHDDGEDNVRSLWYNYYQYHFSDSMYQYNEKVTGPQAELIKRTDYNGRDIYEPVRSNQDLGWGKTINSTQTDGRKPAFFKDIVIYGLNRGNFVSYTLINPVISSWRHDTYDYADSTGVMQHEVQIQYEAVKYGAGKISEASVNGFGVPSRYDTEPGALGPGSTASTFGPGGIVNALDSIGTDLASGNIAGAIRTAGTAARTFGSTENLVNVVTGDTIGAVTGSLLKAGNAPDRLLNFPNPSTDSLRNIVASPRAADD